MNDLIKRSDVIKAVEKRKVKIVYNCESNKWFNKMISEIEAIPSADTFEITKEALIEAIDNAETVGDIIEEFTTADRPQGRWIEHHKPFTWMGFTYWTCSECGYGKNNQNGIQSNFCPNCGARMKGADDEQI